MKVLLTGGCGYIGSHTMLDLLERGHEVICVDDLRNSSKKAIIAIEKRVKKKIPFYKIDICNLGKLKNFFNDNPDINSIVHFAAEKYVNESTQDPLKYYQNNTQGLLNLLHTSKKSKVKYFVFSSSCSVYGTPAKLPVTEHTSYGKAESPYALTKQIGEIILEDYAKYFPLSVAILRYFNPAGAHPSNIIGECAPVAQNLIPLIVEAAKNKTAISIFGDDYPTRDGTCIRDYIHVCDLADAHTRALEFMNKKMRPQKNKGKAIVFNLGSGNGTTVKEAIDAFEKVTNKKIKRTISPRRKGDAIAIYANFEKTRELLSWKARYSIFDIMQTAWSFENKKLT